MDIMDIDGHVQSLRQQLATDGLEKRAKSDVRGEAGGCATPITPVAKGYIYPAETLSQTRHFPTKMIESPFSSLYCTVVGELEDGNTKVAEKAVQFAPTQNDQKNARQTWRFNHTGFGRMYIYHLISKKLTSPLRRSRCGS